MLEYRHVEKSPKAIKRGIYFTYIRLFVYLALSLIFPPFLLSQVGAEGTGYYNYAISLFSFVLLLSFGIENSYVRFASKAAEEGEDCLKKINGIYLILFSIISILMLIVGLVLSDLYANSVFQVEGGDPLTLGQLILIISIFGSVDFFCSFFSWYLYFLEKFFINQIYLLVNHVLGIIVACLLLYLGQGIIYVAISVYGAIFLFDIAFVVTALCKYKVRFIFPKAKEFLQSSKEIFIFSIFLFISLLVTTLYSQGSRLLIGNLYDATVPLTLFTYGFQFYSYESLFSTAISNNYGPSINRSAINNKLEEVDRLFLTGSWAQALILFLLVGGYLSCGQDFINWWLGSSNSLTSNDLTQVYYIGLFTLLIYLLPLSLSLISEVNKSYNNHKKIAVISFINSLISLGIAAILLIYLPNEYKLYGVVVSIGLGTLTTIAVTQVLARKKYGLSIGKFYLQILPIALITLFSYLPVFLLTYFNVINAASIGGLLAAFIEAVIYLAIFILLFICIYFKRLKAKLLSLFNK